MDSGKACLLGARRALPIVLGYLPIGFAYGVLAGKAGLSPLNTLLMSVLVFAGSSQLIAIGLFASGTGPAAVIVTTFIVNLRHLLMAAALSPYLQRWRKPYLAFFAAEITDETFALHASAPSRLQDCKAEVLSLNLTAQTSWVFGTFLGIVASGLIHDVRPFGLDYALAAMFIGLLVGQCENAIRVITACCSGLLAVGLHLLGWQQMHIIVATIVGATAGFVVELCSSKR